MSENSSDDLYDAIRENSEDIHEIARHTGLKPENVAKVKQHLFFNRHWLDLYEGLGVSAEWRRFDSDPWIAESWARLQTGRYLPRDRQLLRHETAEAWYMRKHGPSYRLAHAAAQRRFPWTPEE